MGRLKVVKNETSNKKAENFANKYFYWIMILVNPLFFAIAATMIEVENAAEAQFAIGIYVICWLALVFWRGLLIDFKRMWKNHKEGVKKPVRTLDEIIDDEWKKHLDGKKVK